MPDGKGLLLMEMAEHKERLVAYRTTMSLAAGMLSEGIISEKDYGKIDRIVAKNHGLSLSSICCRIPLITPGTRGNIHTAEGGDFVGKDD